MGLFNRKSRWERIVEPAAAGLQRPKVKSGLAAISSLIGVAVANAAVSSRRRKHES